MNTRWIKKMERRFSASDAQGKTPGRLADKAPGTLQAEKVRLLFSHLPVSTGISAILAMILVFVQIPVIDNSLLTWWSVFLSLALLSRAALYCGWRRQLQKTETYDERRWLIWFRAGALFTGVAWGSCGVLLVPADDLSHRIYVTFVLAGISAGAATTLAADNLSTFGFLSCLLAPQIFLLAQYGDDASLGMSTMILLFLVFLLSSARLSRRQLEENFFLRLMAITSESRLRQLLESSPIAARITDAESNRVVFANSSYITLLDSSAEKILGESPAKYYAHPEKFAEVMEKLSGGEEVTNELIELQLSDELSVNKWVLASYLTVEHQNKPAILGWFYDITDRKLMADQVEHLAYHDALTGLPNRILFLDRLGQAIANAHRNDFLLALIFLDLDKFKPVNDQYGHETGDILLKMVAERIRGCLRSADSLARIGGDEFVIFLHRVSSERNALMVAEKIRHSLNQPFEIADLTLHISSSSGMAFFPTQAESEQELIKYADDAMYSAKANGRNRVEIYRPEGELQKS